MPTNPYSAVLLPDWRSRLREIMQAKRFNARSLALAAGLGESTVSEWLNPKKNKTPSMPSIALVAQTLEVTIDTFMLEIDKSEEGPNDILPNHVNFATLKGELRAGHWIEPKVYAVDDNPLVPIVPHPDFSGVEQYAWKIIGRSMDKIIQPGEYVVGVSFHDIRHWRSLRHRDLVVCERKDGDKYEYTLKRAARTENGYRLDPESTDPMFQEAVWLSSEESGEEKTVCATHLIIGRFGFLI